MGSKYFKKKKKQIGMPAHLQLLAIKQAFSNVVVLKKSWNGFEVKLRLQPTVLSNTYNVKIVYRKNLFVKVFVVDEVMEIAPNRKKLPHVYNSENQQLCLYSPSKGEWKSTKLIVNTIIPWTSEWLFYYELWIPEGQWYGGGHDEYPSETLDKMLKNE